MTAEFFKGKEYVRIKLTQELLEKGILDITVDKQPRQLSISYQHEGKQMEPLVIPVMEFPYPTVDQLDTLVKGSMSLETLTYLKGYIIVKYGPHWPQIYSAASGGIPTTNKNTQQGKENEKQRNKIPIKKYTANGRIPLHESVLIGSTPKFMTMNEHSEVQFKTEIETSNGETFIPSDTIFTQNPLPFIFDSDEELKEYLELAKKENLDSLFSKVEREFRKYVKVEEHYYTIMAGDTIWSHFQDRFPVTHYIIIVGDNDSGKNSALLVYRYLGYRAFYVTSASAANYYTILGNREEGQVTIAEDEAQDLPEDKDKINVLKTGYATGGNVPKVELEGGRRSDIWLTYCHKWFAMEEIPEHQRMKGVIDRSLILKFITGEVPYNIKEVIRNADDAEYKNLYYELVHVRKLLFCFRLLHHKDPIPNIKLNVKNRTSELTKPLIRLFQSSLTKQRILDDLSKFVNERNENKKNSFEAKLYKVIAHLIEERRKLIDEEKLTEEEYRVLGTHTFSNESIREMCKTEMDGRNIEGKETAFYSPEFGMVSQKKITSVLKSKFKVRPPKPYRINNDVIRCIEFNQEYLDRIKAKYDIPDKIEVIKEKEIEKCNSCTDVTLSRSVDRLNYDIVNIHKNLNYEKIIINRILSFSNYNSDLPKNVSDIN